MSFKAEKKCPWASLFSYNKVREFCINFKTDSASDNASAWKYNEKNAFLSV